MSTTIDVRLVEGQHTISLLRQDLAEASAALEKAQHVLTEGDRVLEKIDAGLALTEAGIEKSRRIFPKLVVVVAVVGVGAATFTYVKRRRATADMDR